MKVLVKLAFWLIFGAAGIATVLTATDIQTPWQYTVNSTVGAGSAITVSQPVLIPTELIVEAVERGPEGVGNGGALAAAAAVDKANDGRILHVATPLPLSAQKTVDVGAPASLIIVFLLGSVLTYGLKGRKNFVRADYIQ